jgi:hypothetical protein
MKDELYIDIETQEASNISGKKCNDCGCIFSIVDDRLDFYQYSISIKEKDNFAPAGNYASDQELARQRKLNSKN